MKSLYFDALDTKTIVFSQLLNFINHKTINVKKPSSHKSNDEKKKRGSRHLFGCGWNSQHILNHRSEISNPNVIKTQASVRIMQKAFLFNLSVMKRQVHLRHRRKTVKKKTKANYEAVLRECYSRPVRNVGWKIANNISLWSDGAFTFIRFDVKTQKQRRKLLYLREHKVLFEMKNEKAGETTKTFALYNFVSAASAEHL